MKTVNMKNIIVEIKNRINKINNPNDAGKEIICLPEDQTEHSQKVTERNKKRNYSNKLWGLKTRNKSANMQLIILLILIYRRKMLVVIVGDKGKIYLKK